LGRYTLVRPLGSGGMATVWEATHGPLALRVAVKVLRHDLARDAVARQRFLREAAAAARVRHPHTVEVLDVGGDEDGAAYFVLECLDGETLASRLSRTKSMPLEEALDALLPIFAAVASAHRAGVIHRDIKPSNVFLARAEDGLLVPKVLDFGISKLTVTDAGAHRTDTSEVFGTPSYMAPEQLRSAKSATPKSDQYALAVVLYECLSGERPFDGDTHVALYQSIIEGAPRPLRSLSPSIPERVDRAICRALSALADERFATVDGFARALLDDASPAARFRWGSVFSSPGAAAPIEAHPTNDGPTVTKVASAPRSAPRRAPLIAATLSAVVIGWIVLRMLPGQRVWSVADRPPAPVIAPRSEDVTDVDARAITVDAAVEERSIATQATVDSGSRAANGPRVAPTRAAVASPDAGPARDAVVERPDAATRDANALSTGTNSMPF